MSSNGIISTVSARPVGRGQLMAGGLAATIGSLALAQEAGASQGPVVTGAPAGVAGLAVTGVGEASAPAEAAVVQFIARFGGGFFPGKESAPVPATPVAVPDEALAALVAALTGAGVPEDAIETTTFPDGPFGGPFGPGTALILAQLDGDLLSSLSRRACPVTAVRLRQRSIPARSAPAVIRHGGCGTTRLRRGMLPGGQHDG
ncbi:MAG: hypothetical protein ACRDJH_27035 [Thermomicrobiales bacterium]